MSHSELHLHEYSGRENGLMIIGSADSLRTLATDFIAQLDRFTPTGTNQQWPEQLLVLNTKGPYATPRSYQVSIHVLQGPLPESLTPKRQANLGIALQWAVVLLAIAGAVSVPAWVWKALQ
jgi:hypothetical protein